jgi:hypothetical protein
MTYRDKDRQKLYKFPEITHQQVLVRERPHGLYQGLSNSIAAYENMINRALPIMVRTLIKHANALRAFYKYYTTWDPILYFYDLFVCVCDLFSFTVSS